MEMKTAETQG